MMLATSSENINISIVCVCIHERVCNASVSMLSLLFINPDVCARFTTHFVHTQHLVLRPRSLSRLPADLDGCRSVRLHAVRSSSVQIRLGELWGACSPGAERGLRRGRTFSCRFALSFIKRSRSPRPLPSWQAVRNQSLV